MATAGSAGIAAGCDADSCRGGRTAPRLQAVNMAPGMDACAGPLVHGIYPAQASHVLQPR